MFGTALKETKDIGHLYNQSIALKTVISEDLFYVRDRHTAIRVTRWGGTDFATPEESDPVIPEESEPATPEEDPAATDFSKVPMS